MKLNYRPEIDGLRAISVLSVIFYHAEFELFRGGFVGVDVFFVISGYLITSIIYSEISSGNFSLKNFYRRRIRRIFPALFFVMASCVIFAWLWLLPTDFVAYAQSQVAVSMFASNIWFWYNIGYFDTDGALKPLLHTWSLAVEEQFYLLYPVGFLILTRFLKRWALACVLFVAFLSFAFAQWAAYEQPNFAFYFLPARIWELLVGASVSLILTSKSGKQLRRGFREVCAGVGILMVAYSFFLFDRFTPFPGVFALVPTLGAALIIVFAEKDTWIGRLLSLKIFVQVGLVSYSAYLWHQPIFAFARLRSLETLTSYSRTLLLLATFGLAFFTWKFIETPLRNSWSVVGGRVFSTGVAISVVFMTIGLVINDSKGAEGRFKASLIGDVGHLEFHQFIDEEYFDCEPKSVSAQALSWGDFLRCKQSKIGVPDLILLGDSHAEHLFIGLAEAKENLNVAFYISDSVPLVDNPKFEGFFEEILGNGKRQSVLITFMYSYQFADRDKRDIFDRLELTIDSLQRAGKDVFVLGDVPKFQINPEICKFRFQKMEVLDRCEVSVNQATYQSRPYEAMIKYLSKKKGVQFVELNAALCDEDTCGIIKANQVLYRDNHHLNILGSRLVGGFLASSLNFRKD